MQPGQHPPHALASFAAPTPIIDTILCVPPAHSRPKPLVVDGSCLYEARAGVGHYTAELSKHLARRGLPVTTLMARSRNAEVDNSDLDDAGINVKTPPLWSATARRAYHVLQVAHLPRPNLEDITGPARAYLFPAARMFPTRAPKLSTIHDLTIVLHPDLASSNDRPRTLARINEIIAGSDLVLTVSHAVADEIRACYAIDDTRLRVIPGCPPDLPDPDPQALEFYARLSPVLSVGSLDAKKNYTRLIAAHQKLPASARTAHPLVIVGHPSFRADDVFRAASGDSLVHVLTNVTQSTLAALYTQASVVAQVSLYEGFCLPMVEALRAGVPLVANDSPVAHEVTGGVAVAYPDPYDPDDIAQALSNALDVDRDAYAPAARKAAAKYSWDTSAALLSDALDYVAPL